MWNVLLFIHIVIALLLITFILLQQTNDNGLSGLSSGNNMGLVSARSAANFMTKATITLITLFFINSIILANLSSKRSASIVDSVKKTVEEKVDQPAEKTSLPIAK